MKLIVREAHKSEVGRGIARIDPAIFEEMNLIAGDTILIKGTKDAVALALRAASNYEGTRTIKLDGILRHNAGVSIDDEVEVKKIECKTAKQLMLAPSQQIDFSEDFVDYVHDKLLNTPLLQANVVVIDVMGRSIPLTVVRTLPKGAVRVDVATDIKISKSPVKLVGGAGGISYEDIGGLKDEIEAIREMVEVPMKHPEVFKKLGISPPKGVLLYGPPGTGKTLLARAVANETDANFIPLNGPEIMSKYYGQSEENLRNVFKQAQENTPSIIFIDEIDAIAPSREEVSGEVEKRVVSQLLTLMDGLEARGDVVVIAATNRPNAVDLALRRPGRFDREIEIGIPDRKGRREILTIHTRGMPLEKDVDLDRIANITYGYSGADLEALCKESAMRALRRIMPEIKKSNENSLSKNVLDKIRVTHKDFEDAMRKIEPSAMREVVVEVPNVRWNDIGGLEEIKERLREEVEWPLTKSEIYEKVGVTPPQGILLYGPPGCGKTLLAKAVATESDANFISVKGPELLSKWVGESEKAVRKIFSRARQVAPSILFFDEIDALAGTRGFGSDSGVGERVVAQLLTELDGISSLNDVIVIAATNRPELVDSALLRAGRIERKLFVEAPDEKAREKIFKVQTKSMNLDKNISFPKLAKLTESYSGADIAAVCREAGMEVVRESIKSGKVRKVKMKDFEDAIKKISPSLTEDVKKYWKEIEKKMK